MNAGRMLRNVSLVLLIAGFGFGRAIAQPPPPSWGLEPGCPEPFCPDTTLAGSPHQVSIRFGVHETAAVRLDVWNPDTTSLVATLVDETWAAGNYMLVWNGRDSTGAPLSDGDYPYRLTARAVGSGEMLFQDTKAMRVRCQPWWRLDQNDPDGFCPLVVRGPGAGTTIRFLCPQAAHITIEVLSPDQSSVVATPMDADHAPGLHGFHWSGGDDVGQPLPAGDYPYRMTASDTAQSCLQIFTDTKVAHLACAVSTPREGPSGSARLMRNRPNPFREATRIEWSLDRPARVSVRVVDVGGHIVRTVLDREMSAGPGFTIWDGRDDAGRRVAPGAYFYMLESDSFRGARTLVIVR